MMITTEDSTLGASLILPSQLASPEEVMQCPPLRQPALRWPPKEVSITLVHPTEHPLLQGPGALCAPTLVGQKLQKTS